MASIASDGRYRIVETCYKAEGFAAYKAVDIESRSHHTVLINRYESPSAIRVMLPDLQTVASREPAGFVGMHVESGAVDMLFEYPAAQPLTSAYTKKRPADRETAYVLLEQYLHQLLLLAGLPQRYVNAAAAMTGIRVNVNSRALYTGVLLSPDMPEEPSNMLVSIASVAELLLTRRFCSFGFELDFLDALRFRDYKSLSEVYSAWREVTRSFEEKCPELEGKQGLAMYLYFLGERKKRLKTDANNLKRSKEQAPEA